MEQGNDLIFKDKNGGIVASIEAEGFNSLMPENLTIRHRDCELISPNSAKCKTCTEYGRKVLSSVASRIQRSPGSDIHTPNMYLSRLQLETKAKELQAEKVMLKNEIAKLKKKIKKLHQKESVLLPDEWKNVVPTIFEAEKPPFGNNRKNTETVKIKEACDGTL